MTDSSSPDSIKGLVERDTPLATDELEALNAKWPRIVSAVYAAEARATQAEASLSSLKEEVREVLGPFADTEGWTHSDWPDDTPPPLINAPPMVAFRQAATLYAKLSDGGGEG